jgi:hypothetical protein
VEKELLSQKDCALFCALSRLETIASRSSEGSVRILRGCARFHDQSRSEPLANRQGRRDLQLIGNEETMTVLHVGAGHCREDINRGAP